MKGMFKPKRIIALLLSIALCLSLLPGVEVANAETECTHETVALSSTGDGTLVARCQNTACPYYQDPATSVTTLQESVPYTDISVNVTNTEYSPDTGTFFNLAAKAAGFKDYGYEYYEYYNGAWTKRDVAINAGKWKIVRYVEYTDGTRLQYFEGEFTIEQVPVTITAVDQTITIGESITQPEKRYAGATMVTETGLLKNVGVTEKRDHVVGTATLDVYNGNMRVPANEVKNLAPGTYEIWPSDATIVSYENEQMGSASILTANYDIAYASGTLTVKGAIAEDVETVYDGQPHGIVVEAPDSATVKYSTTEGSYTLNESPTRTDAGEMTVYWKATSDEFGDVTGSNTVTIHPRELTIDWGETSFTYDGEEKTPTITVGNFVEGESVTPVVVHEGDRVNAGTFTAKVTIDDNNYKLPANATQTYTIATRSLTIKAEDQTVFVNGMIRDGVEYVDVVGLASGDTLAAVTLTPSSTAAISTGTITPSEAVIKRGEADVTANYAITFNKGVLTVSDSTLTLIPTVQSKFYGDDDPGEFTHSIDLPQGFVVTGITLSREAGEDAGSYNFIVNRDNAQIMENGVDVTENFNIVCEPAAFTINRRPVTVTANNATKVYGDADPTLTHTVEGLCGGDSAAVTLSRGAGETASGYDINVGTVTIKDGETDVTDNYDVVKVNGIFTITKRPLTVYVENEFLEINSGQEYIEGKLLSREPLVAGHTLSGSVIVNNNEDVNYGDPGRYPLTPANVTISDNEGRNVTDNYDIVTEDGTLVIDYKRILITIPDQIEVGVSGKISVDLTYADDSLRVLNLAIKSENGLKLISPGMSKEDGLPYSLEIADANRENNQMWGISIETTTINTIVPAEENGWADWSIPNMGQMMTGYGLNPLLEYNITATLADGAAPKYAGEYTDTLTFIVCPEEYTYADYGYGMPWDPWDTSLWWYGTIV